MPGRTRLTNSLSQPSCTPACTPRSAWDCGSGATGCEEAQPIALAAAQRKLAKTALDSERKAVILVQL